MDARQRAELKALANAAQVGAKDETAWRLANGMVVLFAMLEAAERAIKSRDEALAGCQCENCRMGREALGKRERGE